MTPPGPSAHYDDHRNSDDEHDAVPMTADDLIAREELEYEFEGLMKGMNCTIVRMHGDGNCLFRAVGQCVYGSDDAHLRVRALCMDYMARERAYFSQFVTENFDDYVARKRRANEHGNHVEMQAMSELFNRPVLVFSPTHGDQPMNTFQPDGHSSTPPIRVSYHHNQHYNAIVCDDEPAVGVGLGLPGYDPEADRAAQLAQSESEHLEEEILRAGLAASEMESIEDEMERAAMRAAMEAYSSALQHAGADASGPAQAAPWSAAQEPASQGLPQLVRTFVDMGYPEDAVVQAYAEFGEDGEAVLTCLASMA
mmetsp:Transcript_10953/g.37251  ORF Transcript_10953/g.37251 Transcript_10953/m.37251 type:complete len:310 (-) Transcript_10953:117-1046(-)